VLKRKWFKGFENKKSLKKIKIQGGHSMKASLFLVGLVASSALNAQSILDLDGNEIYPQYIENSSERRAESLVKTIIESGKIDLNPILENEDRYTEILAEFRRLVLSSQTQVRELKFYFLDTQVQREQTGLGVIYTLAGDKMNRELFRWIDRSQGEEILESLESIELKTHEALYEAMYLVDVLTPSSVTATVVGNGGTMNLRLVPAFHSLTLSPVRTSSIMDLVDKEAW
jgi:hypothetical protein